MSGAPARPVVVVLDVANLVGSRPDGWWRDRAGAARRVIEASAAVLGRTLPDPDAGALPDGRPHPDGAAALRVAGLVAVVEGRAREVAPADGGVAAGELAEGELRVVAAPADGDTTVVEVARALLVAGHEVRVVTADRGLRERLPAGAATSGPGWWNALIGR